MPFRRVSMISTIRLGVKHLKKGILFLSILLASLIGFNQAHSYQLGDSINGGFEQDKNSNRLPDLWETVWRNGSSLGPSASIESYEPVEGKYHLRLYNGSGDHTAFMYVLSDPLPIEQGQSYKVNAFMRYTLPVGQANIRIIETDNNKNIVYETNRSFSNGAWQWHDNSIYVAPKDNTQYIQIRFEIGGEEKAYLDVDKVIVNTIDMNEGFENDQNQNNLSDFWETAWRNGSSIESSVSRQGYDPIGGAYHLRMYSGKGDANSYIYVLSEPVPVTYGQSYDMSAFMRYTLPTGKAVITIIELDSDGNTITEYARTLNNGGWKWHYHSVLVTPNFQTNYIKIRFAVGGEEKAYMDIDQVSVKRLNKPTAWNADIPDQVRYFYDLNGRLNYILLTNGKIVSLNYDRNGSLLKKVNL